MVSYWESGSRVPNDRQFSGLARLYGIEASDLLTDRDVEPVGADLTGMLLRAEAQIDPASAPGIREFVQFLERYEEAVKRLIVAITGEEPKPAITAPVGSTTTASAP